MPKLGYGDEIHVQKNLNIISALKSIKQQLISNTFCSRPVLANLCRMEINQPTITAQKKERTSLERTQERLEQGALVFFLFCFGFLGVRPYWYLEKNGNDFFPHS